MKIFFSALAAMTFATSAFAETETPVPAAPPPVCFTRDQVVPQMVREGAAPVFVGRSGEAMLEVWSIEKRWTAFRSTADGSMCVVAQGHDGAMSAKPVCIDPVRCPRV